MKLSKILFPNIALFHSIYPVIPIIKIDSDSAMCDFANRDLFMAIGTFDGVHIGHKKLISHTIDRARENKGIAAIYTFRPHPTTITQPNNQKSMIFSFDKKYEILRSMPLNAIIEQTFDEQFSKMSPQKFLTFLKNKFLTLREICVGENFKFGHNQLGNAQALMKLAGSQNICVSIIESLKIGNQRVSSSKIRELIRNGNLELAESMLGCDYEKTCDSIEKALL